MRKTFCGWYFKCQSDTQTLAVIAAVHGGESSVQLICDDGAWNFTENLSGNIFAKDGIKLNLVSSTASVFGNLNFCEHSPIKYDIMGPFRFIPFMQCRHSVVSMRHRVNGEVFVNGKSYKFDDALGYIEGDRGHSFPSEYAWTQTFFVGGSLMLSVADIPFAGRHFTGVICVILWQNREYRLASYLGARAVKISDGEIIIRQGRYTFTARLMENNGRALNAPIGGQMGRTIHECSSCRAAYRFEADGKRLFDFTAENASFEFEYGG